jgi:hypothetical protein
MGSTRLPHLRRVLPINPGELLPPSGLGPSDKFPRFAPHRERPGRVVPAVPGERPLLPLVPVGEDGPVTVKQSPGGDQLARMLIAGERQPRLKRLPADVEAGVGLWLLGRRRCHPAHRIQRFAAPDHRPPPAPRPVCRRRARARRAAGRPPPRSARVTLWVPELRTPHVTCFFVHRRRPGLSADGAAPDVPDVFQSCWAGRCSGPARTRPRRSRSWVLRHELASLRRHTPPPRRSWADPETAPTRSRPGCSAVRSGEATPAGTQPVAVRADVLDRPVVARDRWRLRLPRLDKLVRDAASVKSEQQVEPPGRAQLGQQQRVQPRESSGHRHSGQGLQPDVDRHS